MRAAIADELRDGDAEALGPTYLQGRGLPFLRCSDAVRLPTVSGTACCLGSSEIPRQARLLVPGSLVAPVPPLASTDLQGGGRARAQA